MILLASMKHTGTGFMLETLGREVHHEHFGNDLQVIKDLSATMKTIIPLRHPAKVLCSWLKRNRPEDFLATWKSIFEIDGFFFPLEKKPYEGLEHFLGFAVNRDVGVVNSIGDYLEKRSDNATREYIGDQWGLVEEAVKVSRGVYEL